MLALSCLFLLVAVTTTQSQTPTFPETYEARFTQYVGDKVNGEWVEHFEIGTEFVDRPRDLARLELVAYEDVDGTQVAYPRQYVHHPTRTYMIFKARGTNTIQCEYGNSTAPPNPAKLAWKFQETTFIVPSERNSQETIWGARVGEAYTATAKDRQGNTVDLTYVEDPWNRVPVAMSMSTDTHREVRVYRDVRSGQLSGYEFTVPAYFQCKPRQ